MRRVLDIFLGALAVAAAAAVALRGRERPLPAPSGGNVRSGSRPPMGGKAGTATAAATRPEAVASADGLVRLARAVVGRIKEHGTIMIAAGLSYYALLAVFPAALAAVSIYGIAADPVVLENQITELTEALPEETADFIGAQLTDIVAGSSGSLGLVGALTILAALWSASAGTKALITGINYAYDVPETRKFLALRLAALGITFGIIVFGLAAATTVGFLPQILSAVGMEDTAATLINIVRWPFVLLVVVLGLGALYKLAPDRPWNMTRWISIGAVTAAVLWLLATLGLSVYVNNFGDFGATYGTLAGLIVLMLWFFVSGLIVLVGAELNSELEHRGLAA